MMEYSVYTACHRKKAKRLGRPEHEAPLIQRILGWLMIVPHQAFRASSRKHQQKGRNL